MNAGIRVRSVCSCERVGSPESFVQVFGEKFKLFNMVVAVMSWMRKFEVIPERLLVRRSNIYVYSSRLKERGLVRMECSIYNGKA